MITPNIFWGKTLLPKIWRRETLSCQNKESDLEHNNIDTYGTGCIIIGFMINMQQIFPFLNPLQERLSSRFTFEKDKRRYYITNIEQSGQYNCNL